MADLLAKSPEDVAKDLFRHFDATSLDRLQDALSRERRIAPLHRLTDILELNHRAAAELFGVTRQAFTKWTDGAVPADRTTEIADAAAAIDLMIRYLHRDRVAAVARRPAAMFHGRTLLQIFAADGAAAFYTATKAIFAFGDAHR